MIEPSACQRRGRRGYANRRTRVVFQHISKRAQYPLLKFSGRGNGTTRRKHIKSLKRSRMIRGALAARVQKFGNIGRRRLGWTAE